MYSLTSEEILLTHLMGIPIPGYRVFMYNEESAQILLQHHVYVNVVYRMPAIYQMGVDSQTGHCICPALFPYRGTIENGPGNSQCFVWLTFNNSAPRERPTINGWSPTHNGHRNDKL